MLVNGQDIRKELIDALAQSKMLRYLGKNSDELSGLRTMLETSKVITFRKGTILIQEGAKSDRMYFLVSGKVSVTQGGKNICVLARLGDVFGEMGVISGEARSATIKAQSEVTCLVTQSVFAGAQAGQGNFLYSQIMEQAVNRILTGRLRATGEELAETIVKLQHSEAKAAKLTRKNTELERQNEALLEQTGDRFHAKHEDGSPRSTR